jgi:two-component system sensor histidine kinase DesK
MRDVEDVARTALQEVREAVAGYRQARLGDELQNAREILEAAGITYQCVGDVPALPAAQEAALSWAVREGVTNVIKHSRASNCTVRIERRGHEVGIAIEDDGRGSDAASQASGSGLAGLEERVTALGGRFDAGPQPDGGFRLTVTVPLTGARTGSRDAEAARSA